MAKYILVALAANLAVAYMVYRLQLFGAGHSPEILGGDMIFPRRPGYRMLGALILAFFLSFLLPLLISRADKESLVVVILASLLFCWMMVFGIWLMFGEIIVNDNGVTRRFPWAKKTFTWNHIKRIHFQALSAQTIHVTVFAGKREIAIDNTFVALDELLKEMANRSGRKPVQTT